MAGYKSVRVPATSTWPGSREALAFPNCYAGDIQPQPGKDVGLMVCIGPVKYKGLELVQRALANLRGAVPTCEHVPPLHSSVPVKAT